jgi:hypothetical protein
MDLFIPAIRHDNWYFLLYVSDNDSEHMCQIVFQLCLEADLISESDSLIIIGINPVDELKLALYQIDGDESSYGPITPKTAKDILSKKDAYNQKGVHDFVFIGDDEYYTREGQYNMIPDVLQILAEHIIVP